jgi:hypothetical protein
VTTPYPTPLPEAPLSINYRVPEVPGSPQFTLRAASGAELEHLSADVAQHAASIGRYLTEFRAGLLASVGVQEQPQAPSPAPSAAPQYQAPAQQQYAPQQPYQAPQNVAPQTGAVGSAPTCPHGVRKYMSGNKNGKAWALWQCPEPDRNAQCKPEWVSTR